MEEVVSSLETTSDKVRALLREGYLRTEVASFLEIRYQHVRKVAVDAGIDSGLQRGFAMGPALKPPPRIRKDFAVEVLVEAGFTRLGTWTKGEEGISLSTPAPRESGVYAFVVSGLVKYIGLTRMGFNRRMDNYRRGHHRQRTNHRVNAIIGESLAAGSVVEIYLATPPSLTWNGLPVNAAAGLEAGLIEMIQPPWNKMGVEITDAQPDAEDHFTPSPTPRTTP